MSRTAATAAHAPRDTTMTCDQQMQETQTWLADRIEQIEVGGTADGGDVFRGYQRLAIDRQFPIRNTVPYNLAIADLVRNRTIAWANQQGDIKRLR